MSHTLPGLVAILLALSMGAEEKVIPSSQCRGIFIVPVTWNGEVLDLVLDTGAEVTSIDPDALERVTGRQVKSGKKVTMRDGTAGPLKIHKLKARVHEMDHLSLALGQSIDGILGFNVFRELLLTLDYPAGEVRVSRGSLPDPDDAEVFRDIGTSRPFIRLEIGDGSVPVLIDSGFAGAIDLHVDDSLEWDVEPRPVYASVRYSEIVMQRAGRLAHDLRLGPLTIERPVIRVSGGTRLIGAKVLSHTVLTFDHANKRVRMVPDSSDPVRTEPVMSWGFAVRPRMEGMEITKVFPDTSAAEAGLREGDLMVEVDGMHVHERGCSSLRPDSESTQSVLTFSRGVDSFELELPVEVLVP